MPVILATPEAKIRRIKFQSQPGQIVQETLSGKYPSQKRAGGVAQGIGPEFKPQYCKKKKNKERKVWEKKGEGRRHEGKRKEKAMSLQS
jgi:hypothetical protein